MLSNDSFKKFPSSNDKIQANILLKENQSCEIRSTCYFKKNKMSYFSSLTFFSYITTSFEAQPGCSVFMALLAISPGKLEGIPFHLTGRHCSYRNISTV